MIKSGSNSPTNSISRRKNSGLGELRPEAEAVAVARRPPRAGRTRTQAIDTKCGEHGGARAGRSTSERAGEMPRKEEAAATF